MILECKQLNRGLESTCKCSTVASLVVIVILDYQMTGLDLLLEEGKTCPNE
jgi:hypothetical protein